MERLILRIRMAGPSTACAAAKLSALLELERFRDPRILAFLLQLIADTSQSDEIRVHVVRHLRNGRLLPSERPRVAQALFALLASAASTTLRLQAALALGEFTDVPGTLAVLGSATLGHEAVDLRYAAFTSMQRAGPTPEGVALLRQLSSDETLGASARSVLSTWHVR